jgi:hypothetical protein
MENPLLDMLKSGFSQAMPHLLPLLIFAVVAVIAFRFLEQLFAPKRRRWRGRGGQRWSGRGKVLPFQPKHDAVPKDAYDPLASAADQLRTVMGAEFQSQPLLNRSEAKVLAALDKIVAELAPEWRVMAQVSLGEVLKSSDAEAYRCINSKRVDLLLVDGDCRPRHAIEYQGGGHHQGSAAARDAVKKEALRRAGLGYHEVIAGSTTPGELRRLVEKLVGKAAA